MYHALKKFYIFQDHDTFHINAAVIKTKLPSKAAVQQDTQDIWKGTGDWVKYIKSAGTPNHAMHPNRVMLSFKCLYNTILVVSYSPIFTAKYWPPIILYTDGRQADRRLSSSVGWSHLISLFILCDKLRFRFNINYNFKLKNDGIFYAS